MKFFLDHDVPDEVGQSLEYWGHSIVRLRDALAIETTDPEVFAYAQGT